MAEKNQLRIAIALQLADLRDKRNITQDDLKERLGSGFNISDWENGLGCPPLDKAFILARFFKVPMEVLCNEKPLGKEPFTLKRGLIIAIDTNPDTVGVDGLTIPEGWDMVKVLSAEHADLLLGDK